MKVAVTGGSGFIGSHVVDSLVTAGHHVRIVDARKSPFHDCGSVETVLADLLDQDGIRTALKGCDAVVHLAAVADVNDVVADPDAAEAINARGTHNVLASARALGEMRVVYGSTIWVYDGHVGDVDEQTPLLPSRHLYTASKLAGELYCSSFTATFGVPTTVLRFGIPYGPRARPAAVVPVFVGKALRGEALTIAGDGSQTRRFIYVEDLAAGVAATMNGHDAPCFNLVGDQDTSVLQIAETVGAIVGDVEIVHTPGRTADFAGAQVSGELAARELGWRPETSFHDGVERYVEWVSENRVASGV